MNILIINAGLTGVMIAVIGFNLYAYVRMNRAKRDLDIARDRMLASVAVNEREVEKVKALIEAHEKGEIEITGVELDKRIVQ